MRRLNTTLIATALAVLGQLPREALANPANARVSTAPRATPANATRAASTGVTSRVGHRIEVNEHFVSAAADHCEYEANVRGSIARGAGEQYVPDLAVDANVRCLNAQGEHLTSRTLAGQSFSRADLLGALSGRGAVVGVADGRTCTFTPTFRIDGDCLVVQTVTQSCARAGVGGGPDLDE